MQIVGLLPWVAGAGIALTATRIASMEKPASRKTWIIPAALSALFLAWSVSTVIAEGALGFWTEHTRNMWGNQIWFDLLLAVVTAWYLIVPQAKSLGMRVFPWMLLILGTGCIGLLAMLARLLYLQENKDPRAT